LLPVLAVGDHQAVADLIARTRADRHFGWTVDGVCTSTGAGPDGSTSIAGVPVVGDLESILPAVRTTGYRVVAVAPGPGWGPRRLHELAWQLEGTRTELAVEPGLMDVAGPRLHITPMDGMPMVRLSKPRPAGGSRLLRRALDVVGAAGWSGPG
ncbi:MAG TPA: sugar transferase, partial [Pseudonocardia sp.]|nr:sugar transferase [Pseudonocardia sp.]